MDIDELLQQMTLEEKCAQLGGVWFSDLFTAGQFDEAKMHDLIGDGIGQVTRISGTGFDPVGARAAVERIQAFLAEHTRLGIPALPHEEALAGLMGPAATNFPQAIGMASSWDPDLVEEVAAAAGRQVRSVGARLALAPVLDIARDPRWGRLEETFGEDPELASRMGVAFVRGMQAQGVHCCGKHFLGHASTLGGLNHGQVTLGPRRLRDVEAAPFRAAIHEAGLAAVMNAYNDVDGLPVVGASEILTDLLRHELAFDGCVVADYFSIDDLDHLHHIAADREEAARMALEAGLDVELPGYIYYRTLPDQVRRGLVDEALIDRSCRRVLEEKFALGLFDPPSNVKPDDEPFERPADLDLARRAASRTMVLLTNDGVLPLKPGARVAVLGPSADETRPLYGDYSYGSKLTHRGTDQLVDDAHSNGASQGPRRIVTPREAMAERLSVTNNIEGADVAVLFVGGRSGMSKIDTSGEFRDACDLRLFPDQLELIERCASSGIPTVVVLIGGRAHSLSEVVPHANALMMAWLPGDEGSRGIVDVLVGDVDAGGRLPVSLLRTVGQVGGYPGHHHGGGQSILYGDYIDGEVSPLFGFGHGLSYTTWAYSNLLVRSGSTSDDIEVSIAVSNVGDRDGEEVVQLYARDELASVGVPARRLVAFRRVAVAAGEQLTVRFTVPAGRLGFHGRDMRFRVEPGDVTFLVGGLEQRVTVNGDLVHPDPNRIASFTASIS